VTRSTAEAADPFEVLQANYWADFRARLDKKTEENLAKMIKDNNVILQDEFQKMSIKCEQAMKSLRDSVDDSIQGFRAVFETKRLAMEVDKKAANESAIANSKFRSDDSMDMSFQNRTSAAAAFEEVKYVEKEEKKKEKTPLLDEMNKTSVCAHFEEVKYGEKEEKKKEKAALALKHFVFSFLGIKSGEKGVESRHLEGKMIMYYDDVYMRWQHTDFSGMKGGENGVEITRHLVKVLGNLKSFRKSQGYRRWHDTGWLEARMLTTC
jgi:hypothetical protein